MVGCVEVQFFLAPCGHFVCCESVAGVVASCEVLHLAVCCVSAGSAVVGWFPQRDDIDFVGVEFVNEGADFGEFAGLVDSDGLA